MFYIDFNPLSCRWIVMSPEGTAVQVNMSKTAAHRLAERLNAQ